MNIGDWVIYHSMVGETWYGKILKRYGDVFNVQCVVYYPELKEYAFILVTRDSSLLIPVKSVPEKYIEAYLTLILEEE